MSLDATMPPRTEAAPMPRPPEDGAQRPSWSVRGPLLVGVLALAALVLGFGAWSVGTTLAGAVVATGQIEVDRNRQALQHPTGGQVAELLVAEGDRVAAGQPILRFDGAALSSDLAVARTRLAEVRARRARLEAERDGATAVAFAPDLLDIARADPQIADLLEGQRNLFTARLDTLGAEVRQLSRRLTQIDAQIDGLDAQHAAVDEQLALVTEDLARRQDALDRGVGLSDPVMQLSRDSAQLRGRLAEIAASRAEAAERRVEVELTILQREVARREAAIAELREIRVAEQEIGETVAELARQLDELDLRAPVDGTIFGLRVFGPQAVVRAADPVAFLVPEGRPLVITAEVPAIHIDQVYPGQDVTLRFPAFEQRQMPDIFGTVTRVSADAFADEATGRRFYRVEVTMDAAQQAALGDRRLVPGMPVEAYLRTTDRTPLEYLLEPLTAYFTRAMRER